MNLSVAVLHNVSPDMFFRFDPKTSRLYHAHTFQVHADNIEQAANLVWLLANVDDADDLSVRAPWAGLYRNQVTEYRARLNRSLSMSDVLIFHDLSGGGEPIHLGTLAIAAVGHERIETPKYRHGTNQSRYSESYRAHQRWREENLR